jgi:hypothetical protein
MLLEGESMTRLIRFTSVVGADSPLRDEHDRMIDLDDVPLSDELRQALGRWADAAGRLVNVEMNPAVTELCAAGRRLCDRTATELGTAYDVRWDWFVPGTGFGDGFAMLLLLAVVAVAFFGTILLLPNSDASAEIVAAIVFVEIPLLVLTAVLFVRRRARRRLS